MTAPTRARVNHRLLSLLVGITAFASTKVLAGPAAAVHCRYKDMVGTIEFNAYDIALSYRLISFRGSTLPLAGQGATFKLDVSHLTPKLITYSKKAVEIEYKKPDGSLPLMSFTAAPPASDELPAATQTARLAKVVYHNESQPLLFDGWRKGRVTLILQEGPVDSLEFTNCKYLGGAVRNWRRIWDRDP